MTKRIKRTLAAALAAITMATAMASTASAATIQTERKSTDDRLGVLTLESSVTAYTDTVLATLWGILYNNTGADRGGRIVYQVLPNSSGTTIATEYSLEGSAPAANMPPFQHITNRSISYTLYRVRTYGFLFNTATSVNGNLSSAHHTHLVRRG